MKIALYYNLPAGGAKRCIFELTKRLNEKHTIDVYTLSSADREFCNLEAYIKKTYIYDLKNAKLLKFPLSRLNWIIQIINIYKMEVISKKIAHDINSRGYDIVLLNTCIDTEIPFIIKFLKIPNIYFAHSITFPPGIIREQENISLYRKFIRKIFPDFGQKLYNFILNKKKKENIKKVNLVLTVSEYLKKFIETTFGITAKVNYNGVDFNRFKPEKREKEYLVLTIGGLQSGKAHDFVIESVAIIDEKYRPTVGIGYHIGLDKEKEYLINLAKNKNVNLQLFNNHDIVEIYNKAKVVVVVSYFEGLGFVALEAMACGIPVVGVNEGGIRETIVHEKTGLLIDRDHKKFAEAIQFLLENEEVARKYGENGRKYITENWSWEKSAATLEKYFYLVVKKEKINEN